MRELTKADFARGKKIQPKGQEEKIKISILLDEDIVAWFKTRAKENRRNYQTDMNISLRAWMELEKTIEMDDE